MIRAQLVAMLRGMETDEQRRARRSKDQQGYGCIFVLVVLIVIPVVIWFMIGPDGFFPLR